VLGVEVEGERRGRDGGGCEEAAAGEHVGIVG
jgi:hypothetical protein